MKSFAWPNKPKPESILGIMGIFALMLTPGCISMKKHERIKSDYGEQCFLKGIERSSNLISHMETIDEAKKELDALLVYWIDYISKRDVEEMRELKEQGLN